MLEPRSTLFRFCVKFYPPDPALLQEEYTRFKYNITQLNFPRKMFAASQWSSLNHNMMGTKNNNSTFLLQMDRTIFPAFALVAIFYSNNIIVTD